MRIEDIRYFIKVAECESISGAARDCYITQQGLSRIIASMEKELNVRLLRRAGKTVHLTDVGKVFLSAAREVEQAYVNMLDCVGGYVEKHTSCAEIFTIYASSVICVTCLSRILSAAAGRFPFAHFNVIETVGPVILDNVELDGNSIGIISAASFLQEESLRLTNGSVQFDKYFSDQLMCSAHESNPIANKSAVSLNEFASLPLVCHNTEVRMVKRLLGEKFSPSLVTNTTSSDLCNSIIRQGYAVGMTSAIMDYYNKKDESIVSIPFEKTVRIDYGCVFGNPSELGEVGQEIIRITKNEFKGIKLARQTQSG